MVCFILGSFPSSIAREGSPNNVNDNNTSEASLSDSRMVITKEGNVGIGITNPQYPLDVYQTGVGGDFIRLQDSAGNINAGIIGLGDGGGGESYLDFKAQFLGGLGSNASIRFYTRTGGGASTNTMILRHDGNLGIGETNPTKKLVVTSTTSGIVIPRLTSTEITALTPIAGEMVYNTTTNKHQGYDGTIWNDFY